ncbi:MAG: ABC transporter permease [Acidobacteria bacterium]|nr:ABC transporter permease [Acidobacteriota bacterium]MBI3426362.1 ABC transporter permease [Acidobacteriota bacterium]
MPNWNHLVRHHLAPLRLPPTRESEIVEELALHLEAVYEDALADGLPAPEAEARAVQSYDWHSLECELSRAEQSLTTRTFQPSLEFIERRGGIRMESLLQDLRFGARMLFKQPGFTLIAVFTLALGIGACTAIFSVVYTVLLRPLPFAEQKQLVALWKRDTTTNQAFVELAMAEVRDWRLQAQSLSDVAAMPATVYGYGYVLTGRGEAVQLESAKVSGGFFAVLGAQAALGRVLSESDDVLNGPKVVVLSERLWRERFNADANIIGQSITLTEANYTVVGVMPAKFEYPKGVDLWLPFKTVVPARQTESYGMAFLTAVGRLKPGVTLAQAEAELNAIVARIAAAHPELEAAGQRIVITPLAAHLFGDARPALWLLLAATGMLLLIAAANIANLSLARATARRREFAVRAALGAGRLRLVRQLLTESFLLALAGGIGGVALSYWLIKLLVRVAPADIPRIEEVSLNLTVLLFSLVVALLTAILCGVVPALTASRLNLNQTLNEGGTKMAGERSGTRTRSALVIAEVAITVVLLVGATLILRSFVNLSRLDLGFDTAHTLTMQLRLQGAKYGTPEARRDFFRHLIERLEAKPGVEAASAVLIRPMEGPVGWDISFTLEGQSGADAMKNRVPNFEAITPHYFRTIKLPLKAGREFTDFDTEQSQPIAIISETMARTVFGAGVDPLGKQLKLDLRDSPWRTIVGVVGDTRYRALQDARFDLYIPFAQWPMAFVNHFAVRTKLDPQAVLLTVRAEVAALDPTQAITRVATMEELVATHLAQPRFSAVLLNWLSGLALLLAAIGIYGVLAYTVARRTGEFGIRLALGARGVDLLRLVVGQGMRLVLVGLSLGLVVSVALMRLLEKLLFGVRATDPLSLFMAALLLTLVALLACLIPAQRAAKVDPLVALRHE